MNYAAENALTKEICKYDIENNSENIPHDGEGNRKNNQYYFAYDTSLRQIRIEHWKRTHSDNWLYPCAPVDDL